MKTAALTCVAGLAAASDATRGSLVPRDGLCRRGSHSCLDIGHADQCCENESYCYVNRNHDPRCCPVGSNCVDDSPCKSDRFYCRRPTAGTVRDGCCGRSCPQTSHYLCPHSLGGGCCPYGADCQAGGNCLQTTMPMPSPTATRLACTSRQSACAGETGCCSHGQPCTGVSQTALCTTPGPSDRRLSRGALAGIGVGSAAALSVVTTAAVWLCLCGRRRRLRQRDQGKDAMTDTKIGSRSSLPPRLRPLTDDYSGPNPVSGPYTETAVPSATRLLEGLPRAVPTRPEGPGDIAAPVEMESPSAVLGRPTSKVDNDVTALRSAKETTEGRFELYGCEAYKLPQLACYSVPDTPRTCESDEDLVPTR
ncbi:hypothetical protein GQ602_002044 [Ophiocordyceps camponoti-floridani]|uniref:Uncharacterized protein n=1 Tax=Ophiocordyceps camponoti-floridani TaxID=2030778 RepID=A0A8H4VEX7_9HYPO|nr:hypothetical protein GQ602_002044 [Ophiocordyceps camponoti-floridani]